MYRQTSRREFLGVSGAALAAVRLGAYPQRPTERRLFAYVGRHTTGPGFTGTKGGGVDVFRVNMTDGSLTPVSKTGPEVEDLNSDGICVSADGHFLYSIYMTPALGGRAGAGGGVAAFAINSADGSLRHLNTQPSMGSNPASVIVDKTNARAVVANHGAINRVVLLTKKDGVPVIESPTDDATVTLFPVKPDGSLDMACDVSVFDRQPPSDAAGRPAPGQPGPLQRGPACHTAVFDRTERWVIATDNGFDRLYVYRFSPSGRTLEGKSFVTPPGRAPRHLVVHPRLPYFFMTNEREPSVSSFGFDSNTGDVRPVQTVPTIPDNYSGPRVQPSNIRIHPNGKFVYSANRGDDSIAVFAVDEGTGRLTRVAVVKTGGQNCREFNIEPSGKYLFVCNLQSNEVATFALNSDTGTMTPTTRISVQQATVIDFATL
jgi:6-phosphogluconolactonase